jgi:hypothetical protein
MHKLNATMAKLTVPPQMRDLPISSTGYVVPWFVSRIDGEWNFQAVDPGKIRQAFQRSTCWICGGKLHKNKAFCIGPMCAITRTSSEPPSHCECATFAVKACPFLARPRMRRLPRDEGIQDAPGIMLDRNPGVTLIWVCRNFSAFQAAPGDHHLLFKVGDPVRIEAWSEGRTATPEELEASIAGGLPSLLALAQQDEREGHKSSVDELLRMTLKARRLLKLPTEVAA